MDNLKMPKRAAYSALQRYRLTKPSLDDLITIATDSGYSVLDYSQSANESNIETIICELSLESFARNGMSFVYKNNDIKLIFLCETMNTQEKQYALAHELGHILCGHLKDGYCSNKANLEEEFEANEFAHYLLHPERHRKAVITIRKHKVISIIIFAIIFFGIISIPVVKHIRISQSFYGEYYVTENGEKYHIKNCPVLKGKDNIHRLTIEEFESGRYGPCHICFPEVNN